MVRDTGEWDESEGALRARLGINEDKPAVNPVVLEGVSSALDNALTEFATSSEVSFLEPTLAGGPSLVSIAVDESYICHSYLHLQQVANPLLCQF